MTATILKATDLSKTDHKGKITILSRINIEVRRGEYVAIMGRSGAGKSTLLYCLSGMDRPSSGEVYIADKRIDKLDDNALSSVRRRIGFVFQQINLIPHLSLVDNVALASLIGESRRGRASAFTRAASLLDAFGLSSASRQAPAMSSGGEQQRAAVARALMTTPDVLFADEPTGALNSRSGREVLDVFDQTHAQGQTILMVTHDPKAAARASRIIYLSDGEIVGNIEFAQILSATTDNVQEKEQAVLTWLISLGW
jgi:putative ABC transport system ATP-binding protein